MTCSWCSVLPARSARYVLALLTVFLVASARSATIEGVRFDESWRVDGSSLILVGTGLQRYMFVYKVCVAGLYLPEGTRPADALTDVSKRLEIQYFHKIKAEQFATLTRRGVRENATASEFRQVKARLAQFNAAYRNVKPRDRYALTYRPGKGSTLSLNGRDLITIQGADFARALYAVWLGGEPVTDGLKSGLLGED